MPAAQTPPRITPISIPLLPSLAGAGASSTSATSAEASVGRSYFLGRGAKT